MESYSEREQYEKKKDAKNLININQIDNYASDWDKINHFRMATKLDVFVQLNDGIRQYRKIYKKKVTEFQKNKFHQSIKNDSLYFEQSQQYTYFRSRFVDYLQMVIDKSGNEYNKDIALRSTAPEKCTISIHKFLGTEGEQLWLLALEEEVYSTSYINAILDKSLKTFSGAKWDEKLIVIIGGPSGSGKSSAAIFVLEESSKIIKKDYSMPDHTNFIIFVDGGLVREVSQMRKLVLQVVNYKGYTGIIDLHKQCEILEKVKKRMMNFALHEDNPHGVVIPETFAAYTIPIANHELETLLNTIGKYPGAKIVFAQIKGEDPANFKEVVMQMGIWRAFNWKGKPDSFDMNRSEGLSESKPYEPKGFSWGKKGSKQAAANLIKQYGDKCFPIFVINDLILLQQGNKKLILSRRIVEDFSKIYGDQQPLEKLEEFKNNPEYKNIFPYVENSAQFKLLQLENQIFDHLVLLANKITDEHIYSEVNDELVKFQFVYQQIDSIKHSKNDDTCAFVINNMLEMIEQWIINIDKLSKEFSILTLLREGLLQVRSELSPHKRHANDTLYFQASPILFSTNIDNPELPDKTSNTPRKT